MQLKAQRMIDENHVCKMDPNENKGVMRVKPTTFSTGVMVDATILCPTCDCEKVRSTQKHS